MAGATSQILNNDTPITEDTNPNTIPSIADMLRVAVPSFQKWVLFYRKTGIYWTGKVSREKPQLYTKGDKNSILSLLRETQIRTLHVLLSLLICQKTSKSINTIILVQSLYLCLPQ